MRRKTFLNIFSESYCRFKKKHYLCIAIEREIATKKLNGALVQLVRIHACHAWGHGFESRTHRLKVLDSFRIKDFFLCFSCFRHFLAAAIRVYSASKRNKETYIRFSAVSSACSTFPAPEPYVFHVGNVGFRRESRTFHGRET